LYCPRVRRRRPHTQTHRELTIFYFRCTERDGRVLNKVLD